MPIKVKGLTQPQNTAVNGRLLDCVTRPPEDPFPVAKGATMTKRAEGSGATRNDAMATRLTTAGRDPHAHHGYVNTPVYHASTMLYPSAEAYAAHRSHYQYGRRGTPTSEALQNALKEIEGPQCEGVALLPSGLSAITT